MKRTIFAGILALTAGLSSLLAQTAAAPPKGPTPKSDGEKEAINTLAKATDPEAIIKAADNLTSKFADSDFKEWALTVEAKAYKDKGDVINAQVYAEQVLAINPKSFTMEMQDAELIETGMKEHDLDRDTKIAKVNKLLTGAIADISAAVKPTPKISDADWDAGKKFSIAQAHQDLGMLAQVQKKWPDAIAEYKLAVEGDPEQDSYSARLAAAYLGAGKADDAIATCDKLLAKPNLHPAIKQYVSQIKTAATNSLKK
jgi:tetratricopeptide (TPR) repeat protein